MGDLLSLEWLAKAEEDFQAAFLLSRKRKPSFSNSVCFHSQQAAEKYLKAYLSSEKVLFPKTHDLILLQKLCAKEESNFELIADLVRSLNPYSVEFRYPGEDANHQEAKYALSLAKEIKNFVQQKLK
ncbi:MAG: HEPN domain-containing protein [Chlamydiae bacterium]|nr:HEPN domain-containing protein [Chlamydiota bacterium]MBI3277829.1 HEPN domain-containing protein [Chlamydiota bacterium]